MSVYTFDCDDCGLRELRRCPDGSMAYYCPEIADGRDPLVVEGDCGANYVISCAKYRPERAQTSLFEEDT